MYGSYADDDWVSPEECAQRLNLSVEQVLELVQRGILRSNYDGGYLLVQPALIAGVTC